MRSKIYVILLLCITAACSRSEQKISYLDLNPEKLNIADNLSLFQLVFVSDSSLIATVASQQVSLVKVPIDGVSPEIPFLKVGRGPYEVPICSPVTYHNDTIHVLYSSMSSISSLRIPLEKTTDCSQWIVTDYSSKNSLLFGMGFGVLEAGEYVVSSADFGNNEDKSVLQLIREDLTSAKSIPFWPDDGYTGPGIPKKSLYMNSRIHTNGSKVLYVADEGKYATILDISKSPVSETLVYPEYPSYTASSDGFNWHRTPESSLGCYSFATSKRIYLAANKAKLNNGKYEPEDINGYPPYYVDSIEVYDWDGKYRHTLRAGIPFCNFWVDEKDSTLFFLTVNLETSCSEVYKCRI